MNPILHAFGQVRVLVIGDAMLDRYYWGRVDRISPEAPVPIVALREQTSTLGGAGNVASNLAGLGVSVRLFGVRGDDPAAAELSGLLGDIGVENALTVCPGRPTTTKTRVMAQRQQLLRLDEEARTPLDPAILEAMSGQITEALDHAQAVILSDYGKGVLTPEFTRTVIAACRQRRLPVLVDPKGNDWSKYAGATGITPNTAEFAQVCSRFADNEDQLAAAAAEVADRLNLDCLLVTRGAQGMALIRSGRQPLYLTAKAREVFDVSGAGDTVIATFAAGLASGRDMAEAAYMSNIAAGIVVGKLGTRPVQAEEFARELERAAAEGSDEDRPGLD